MSPPVLRLSDTHTCKYCHTQTNGDTHTHRDRVSLFWEDLSSHLSRVILTSQSYSYLLERTVVALLRLSIRLLTKETMATQVNTRTIIVLIECSSLDPDPYIV